MRAISNGLFYSFLPFYWIFSVMAWQTVRLFLLRVPDSVRKYVSFLLVLFSVWQSVAFIVLFRLVPEYFALHHYNLYFGFNALLVADILCRAVLSVCFLFSFSKNLKYRQTVPYAGLILSAGIVLTFLWAVFWGVNRFERNELVLDFRTLPTSFDGFRVVQFSDTHFGSFRGKRMLERMSVQCNDFDPDLVVFTGDLVNQYAGEADEWLSVLQSFRAAEGKFAVRGNHDYGDYAKGYSPMEKERNSLLLQNKLAVSGFRLLENESVMICREKDTIYLVGTGNWGTPPFHRYADLKSAEAGIPESAFRIILSHDPSCWPEIAKAGYPLCLSGHTHGFQWGIKLAGLQTCLLNLLMKYTGGLYYSKGRYLYVNRGTGSIGMAFRLDMPAEITCITLRKR